MRGGKEIGFGDVVRATRRFGEGTKRALGKVAGVLYRYREGMKRGLGKWLG